MSEAIAQILADLPRRLHHVAESQAGRTPDRVALIDDRGAWSYRNLVLCVGRVADALTLLGIRSGDRVMIVSENCIALAGLLLAMSRLDAWAIVVDPKLSAHEVDQIRDHSGSRRIFYTAAVSREAALHADRVGAERRLIGPFDEIAFGALNEDADVEPTEEGSAEQVAVLIYTSETTSAPKGVMLTHENLLVSAKTAAIFRKLTSRDKVYLGLPISHIMGLSLLTMALMIGATARLVSSYDPAALSRAIAEEGITILDGVPATYQRLLEYKTLSGMRRLVPGALRIISLADPPLDLALKSRVEAELGLPLSHDYGATECSGCISDGRVDARRTSGSVGVLLPGVEARVRTLDGIPSDAGEVGELHVRGRNVMRGYYRAPELTAKFIDSEGWFNTGDLARFEGDLLYIVGRSKEMIVRSGFNVRPAEVRAVLNSHDEVLQSTVVERAADGEAVAFVHLIRGARARPSDLMAYVATLLAPYECPAEVILLDAIPATVSQKNCSHKLVKRVVKLNGHVLRGSAA
ncbi:class I adenylate-forming enzyme family protein [Bradyrhizobium sp. USDA 4454]